MNLLVLEVCLNGRVVKRTPVTITREDGGLVFYSAFNDGSTRSPVVSDGDSITLKLELNIG